MPPSEEPTPLRLPRGFPPVVLAPTVGGGGTTVEGNDGTCVVPVPLELMLGGGGTTSVLPKILPIQLLISDPPVGCEGGGGTTVAVGLEKLPPARCVSEISVEGGGATTAGAGMFNFAVRALDRSGADTGGGTTRGSVICTCEREDSGVTVPGAGGITFAARVGADRDVRCETSGEGAITLVPSDGAGKLRPRATCGAEEPQSARAPVQ